MFTMGTIGDIYTPFVSTLVNAEIRSPDFVIPPTNRFFFEHYTKDIHIPIGWKSRMYGRYTNGERM